MGVRQAVVSCSWLSVTTLASATTAAKTTAIWIVLRGVGGLLSRLDVAMHELPRPGTTHTGRPAQGEHSPAIAAAVRSRGEDDNIDHPDRDLDVGRRDRRPRGM